MAAARTEVPGFTTNLSRSRGFAGFGVKCSEHLCLDFDAGGLQDKIPYDTEEKATRRITIIEKYQRCLHNHAVVRVYHTQPGRKKDEDD